MVLFRKQKRWYNRPTRCVLYTREILPAPEYPVENGKPVFGTFQGPFGHFDIRGMKRPFGNLPIPELITNRRIMGIMRFLFCDDRHIGEIELFDAGYFSFMETTLWNRTTGRRIAYRRIIPPGFMKMPIEFSNSVTSCRSRSRFTRIHMRLQKKIIHADFDFLGSWARPPCEGRFEMDLSAPGAADLSAVTPYRVRRRCQASFQQTAALQGWIGTGYDDYRIPLSSGVGFFDVRKAYFSLRTKMSRMIGMGRLDGKIVSFQIGNSVTREDLKYNDNVLFVDGTSWPLPPVKITRPYGVGGVWIIQDTESMVDLTFTPISDSARKLSALVLRTDYHTVYGTYDGVLLTGDGTEIRLKGYPGIGKKILLRI
ncbi:MAG: DUF2804 domain-containing protein [Spirochaetales bacterium]|nr:DUF2804 domain-containing protein [Spirochaetales bacterium]